MSIFKSEPEDRDLARVCADLRLAVTADSAAAPTGLRRILNALRDGWRSQVEAQERLAIINRPWLHDNLHWHELEDGTTVLHGSCTAPNARSIPVTTGGWCPNPADGVAADSARIPRVPTLGGSPVPTAEAPHERSDERQ
jgi:hypothetical protein